jgi:hypothetical protein
MEKLNTKQKIIDENRSLKIVLTRNSDAERLSKKFHPRFDKEMKIKKETFEASIDMVEKEKKVSEVFECKICEKKCQSKLALMFHLRQIHNEAQGVFMCTKCPFEAKTLKEKDFHAAKVHRKTHCEICDKTYLAKKDFLNHMKLHANADGLKCKYCGQICKNFNGLGVHLKNHQMNPEWTKECKICMRKFYQVQGLETHIQTFHQSKIVVRDNMKNSPSPLSPYFGEK